MTHGSLFSGIGGFDYAAEKMGWENLFHCEWNEFGQKVLHYYWPKAELFKDITTADFKKYANKIDVLTGGFPCQPYSAAGKRLGKADERHLWPQMLRAIRQIKPRWVIGENVYGLVNWNDGMVFNEVQTNLEDEGYEVQPYILPAAAVNAPHRRDRVWFVAYATIKSSGGELQQRQEKRQSGRCSGKVATYTNCDGPYQCNGKHEINSSERGQYAQCNTKQSDGYGDVTNPSNKRLQRRQFNSASNSKREKGRQQPSKSTTQFHQIADWKYFPTQSPICGRNDGLPTELDGITFPKWRNESIKAFGNAIVPQVAIQLFKTIEVFEERISLVHCDRRGSTAL